MVERVKIVLVELQKDNKLDGSSNEVFWYWRWWTLKVRVCYRMEEILAINYESQIEISDIEIAAYSYLISGFNLNNVY